MTSTVDVSVPTTSVSATPKPFTAYHISLRLPLRTFTLQKRYSDFVTLHSQLCSQAGVPPPATLPHKTWFTSSTSSPALTEQRRKDLETYLQTLNSIEDDRWRNTPAWRSFLNLPSTVTSRSSEASNLHGGIPGAGGSQAAADPVVWLDLYHGLKGQLHDARLQITMRDQATAAQAQHECSAQAKKHLVKAGTITIQLEQGLQQLGSESWGREKQLGDGELRRRKDLIENAKREREGLENLLNAMVVKSSLDATISSARDKEKLVGGDVPSKKQHGGGRVLGKETKQTKALDNLGVLQLQQQMMQEQDEDVNILAQAVAKQRQLGMDIQQELAVQNDMLKMLDEDVDRVQGKMDVAKKRIGKIS
ncbi:MAG: hypothetical protein Q9167_004881 [Letrouitia subvulpina]